MMEGGPRELDPLRRFLPRPYIFSLKRAEGPMQIESNDLEIALAIRSRCLSGETGEMADVLSWIVLRDYEADSSDGEVALVTDERVSTLLIGQGTMLVFDRSLRRVLGFVSCYADMQYLMTALVPLLLEEQPQPFTNK